MTNQTTEAASRTPEPQEILRMAVEYHLRNVNVSLPGQIEEWDKDAQRASVKPLVQRLIATEEGEELVEALPIIPGVPVVFERGGGFYSACPVKKGDFCHLVFNHYSIDTYKSGTGKDSNPQDFRTHDLSDAVAYMGFHPFSKAIPDLHPDRMIMGKEKGTQIHILDGMIEFGKKDSAEEIPLESKLQSELNKIATELSKINTALGINDTHTHVGNLGSPTGPPIPLMAASISYTESPTNSELLKVEK